jgi:pyruvate dehydrogenase E2 component (dihydrolipoamide acetyltransferase)
MAHEFRFPDVGEGIHEGRIVQWLVAEGDAVGVDTPLVKVETDKAVVEIPSPKAGRIARLHFAAGDVIHVGDVIVTIAEAGEGDATTGTTPARTTAPATAPAAEPASPGPHRTGAAALLRPAATPHTRALAREAGIDIASVAPTGPGGRITDEDVRRAAAGKTPPTPTPTPTPTLTPTLTPTPPAASPSAGMSPALEERVPLSHLRKVIAEAMSLSVKTAAHVTHVDEADVTELIALRKRLRERTGEGRLTLLPFFVRALVAALRTHPRLNATVDLERGELVLKRTYHVGFAVDTPEGLIVPVIRDADRKSLADLAAEIDDLARRARDRTLKLEEIRGGTVTITNIGPVGGLWATPIIRQPELAIVGTHAIQDRPVVRDGAVVARKMMYASVSFDHRFIDGAEAARFMTDFTRLLGDPELLMARM